MNNYEKIKNMTVEEMTKYLKKCDDCYTICLAANICRQTARTQYCELFIKQWLLSEAE